MGSGRNVCALLCLLAQRGVLFNLMGWRSASLSNRVVRSAAFVYKIAHKYLLCRFPEKETWFLYSPRDEKHRSDDRYTNEQSRADKPPGMPEPRSALSFSCRANLVSGGQSDLRYGIRSTAGFIVSSEGSRSRVRRVDLAAALVDCNAQLLGSLYRLIWVDLVTSLRGGTGRSFILRGVCHARQLRHRLKVAPRRPRLMRHEHTAIEARRTVS